MSVRLLLADDQRILRSGLRSLFVAEPGYEVLAEAQTGEEAIAMAADLVPDIVIMDITMPGIGGVTATAEIVRRHPEIRVVMLSVHSDRRFIEKAIAAGALGYLRKDCDFGEMLKCLQDVREGKLYISPSLAGSHPGGTLAWSIVNTPPEELTVKEVEVLRLIAMGKTSKDISAEINLGTKSVERYRQVIMEKLNLHTVAELTKYAIEEGLLPLD